MAFDKERAVVWNDMHIRSDSWSHIVVVIHAWDLGKRTGEGSPFGSVARLYISSVYPHFFNSVTYVWVQKFIES